ncbi:MotA/TolQ/ExbB proton channel family protein [Pseudomonas sp. SJZ079]|uniref:MotA/TolQ/ExbB proton channel family protein n=1 Tax=Pseudomonas sp. SJZ079 TaxID=2572887 RepID=UPI002113A569|nr:MotA/TolQ/ExbB proton channel family protein [Pseudomonas sp. SJZ079]
MMLDSEIFTWVHQLVGWLLQPVTLALLLLVAVTVWDIGVACGECLGGLRRWRTLPQEQVERRARKRLERCDLIARLGPILGLMGTLIPLGPGLAALGDGDIQVLSVAMRVAFDATVLGLLGGMGGFVLGRLRRRWYDELLDSMQREQEVGDESLAI